MFSLLSLNLWNGGRLMPKLLAFLNDHPADIYTFQETYNSSDSRLPERYRTTSILQQNFPEYHMAFSPLYRDISAPMTPIDDGQCTLSKFPIIQRKTLRHDIPYCDVNQNEITDVSLLPSITLLTSIAFPEGELLVGNVHGPVFLEGDEPTQRRKDLVRDLLEVQIVGGRQKATIFVGDFNARSTNPIFEEFSPHLRAVFGNSLPTTFNIKRKDLVHFPGYAHSAVDQIFVSPKVYVHEAKCHQVDVSDHLPISLRFSLQAG